jgi:hypothetical protein
MLHVTGKCNIRGKIKYCSDDCAELRPHHRGQWTEAS